MGRCARASALLCAPSYGWIEAVACRCFAPSLSWLKKDRADTGGCVVGCVGVVVGAAVRAC
eukprot:365427-Chlamydomonas_euryale.AAC.14